MAGADFTGANMLGADLRGVDLSTCTGLTPRQLGRAITDEHTVLPGRITARTNELLQMMQAAQPTHPAHRGAADVAVTPR